MKKMVSIWWNCLLPLVIMTLLWFSFNLKRKVNKAQKSLPSYRYLSLSSHHCIRLRQKRCDCLFKCYCVYVSLRIRLLISLKRNVIKQIHVVRLNVAIWTNQRKNLSLLNGCWLSPNQKKRRKKRNATPSSIIRNLVWKFQLIENLFQWIHKSVFIIWIDCMRGLGPQNLKLLLFLLVFFSVHYSAWIYIALACL